MSLKSLFGKKSLSVTPDLSQDELAKEIESIDYTKEYKKEKDRFVPTIDWSTPANFAKFGSAEKYYTDAIKSIYKTYPYDGSLKEKLEWSNNSSDLVNYVFENIYPRNNGYINLGVVDGTVLANVNSYYSSSVEEYIYFNGTLNKDQGKEKLKDLFEKSNKLDLENNRGYNLNINGDDGVTIEFYLKKQDLAGSPKQVIFDLWNGEASGSSDYGRLKVEIHPGVIGKSDKIYLDVNSGSAGVVQAELGSGLDFVGAWHHYGISFKNDGPNLKIELFVDGDLHSAITTGTSISQVYGAINGRIGSLITSANNAPLTNSGWGQFRGSLDEFRYWKKRRTEKQIYLNYNVHVGGGANTDDETTDLGLYYKFNEGIFTPDEEISYDLLLQNENGDYVLTFDGEEIIIDSGGDLQKITNFDRTILDYSGRISNGVLVGYTAGSRSRDSGIVLSSAAKQEFKDPVVFGTHPRIRYLLYYYSKIGDEHDRNNSSYVYNTLPEWIADEDSQSGDGVKNLLQILSEFFDDLQMKMEFIPKIKNIDYPHGKPFPFTEKLLHEFNFDVGDIFSDINLLELFYNKNEDISYEEKIYNIKNTIYQNIYNNLLAIYRSKGTENSFRNLLRCFGIDERLVRLNMYANDAEFVLKDRYTNTSIEKKYADFNNVDRFDSTIYQWQDPSNPNSLGYLSGSEETKHAYGFTMESECIFPTKPAFNSDQYFETPFISCSLFGLHESTDGTWANPSNASVQVFAIKQGIENADVKFLLSSSHFGVELVSDTFKGVYNNQKWNFSFSLRDAHYPFGAPASLAQIPEKYILEFYGTSYFQDIQVDSFTLTTEIDGNFGQNFIRANKMIYIGAHRENFSGSVVVGGGENSQQFSDAKISSVRVWNSYLETETIQQHAKDPNNFGGNYIYGDTRPRLKTFFNNGETIDFGDGNDLQLLDLDTLCLHWDFSTVTSSNNGSGNITISDGQFLVEDISSGSLNENSRNSFRKYSKYQQTGRGDFYPINNTDVVQKEYLNAMTRTLPETLISSDAINILAKDDEFFYRNKEPVEFVFSLEKSMYQAISEDMLKMFGTVAEFSNLIGKPKDRYQREYGDLRILRELYFSQIENEPDFEKFLNFYKWIDSSVSLIIEKLIPGSMNLDSSLSNVVENHILQRNKYEHKFPTIEFKGEPPLGPAKTINELLYNWKTGHAPLSGLESDNCDWWKLRAERVGSLNEERQKIFSAATSALNRNFSTVYNLNSSIITNTFVKKRETEIIRNEVSFDLSGTEYYEITEILPPDKDCDDE